MDRDDTGCQASLEGPFLCINNCGFFGSAATKNMCSKCHRNMILNQGQAKLSASSTESIVNGLSRGNGVEPVSVSPVVPKAVSKDASSSVSVSLVIGEEKAKKGPTRCTVCNKRVGLTGFSCRCENLFCAVHRYSDKHECAFDYQSAAQDAISKANPVVKSEKLDKI